MVKDTARKTSFALTIDDKTYQVQVLRPGTISIDGNVYTVEKTENGVQVDDETFVDDGNPAADPFVTVGDHVDVGQTLCILEAMKLMNEIEAEVAGTVIEVLPENAQPVEYGEGLFRIRPER